MRNYQKPLTAFTLLLSRDSVSSLNEWLEANLLSDAGIVTYVIQS